MFFNMNYFGEFVINGEWDKAVKYLSAFTMPDDNQDSAKIFLTLEKQKDLETLGRWVLGFYIWVSCIYLALDFQVSYFNWFWRNQAVRKRNKIL